MQNYGLFTTCNLASDALYGITKQSFAQPSEGAQDPNYLLGLGGTALGAKGVGFFSPMARGKGTVGWHGSSPENMKAMRQEGIRTMGEMADRGQSLTKHILDAQGGNAFEQSRDMSFIGPKGVAKEFMVRSKLGPAPTLGDDNFQNYFKKLIKERYHPKMLFARPLRVEVPAHLSVAKPNPEVESILDKMRFVMGEDSKAFKFWSRFHPSLNLLRKSPGISGGVKPEWIQGGKGFQWISRAGLKAKPVRAVGGALGLLASLGLAGNSVRGMLPSAHPSTDKA